MKKLSVLLFAFSILASSIVAQTRTVTTPVVQQGNSLTFGGTQNFTTGVITGSDSLQVSDSIAYFVPINHVNFVDPFLEWSWTKIGAGTATITLSFLQSNDNWNWSAVPKGVALSAYSKSYTLSASGVNYVDFRADSALFSGRYLKVYYITSSTASVKGKLYNLLKTNIR